MVVINLHMLGRLGPCHHLAECYYFTSGMLLPSQMGTKSFSIVFWKTDNESFLWFFFLMFQSSISQWVCLNVFERIIFLSSHAHGMMFHSPVIYPLIGSWFSVFKKKKKERNAIKQFQTPPGGLRISLPRVVPICSQWVKNLRSEMSHVTLRTQTQRTQSHS